MTDFETATIVPESDQRSALKYLVEEVGRDLVDIKTLSDGRQVVCHPDAWKVTNPPEPPAKDLAAAIQVSTLYSLVAFIAANLDELQTAKHYLHVASPTRVLLVGPLVGQYRQREIVAIATCQTKAPLFGTFAEPDDFNTMMLARFVPPDGPDDETNYRDQVLAVTSKIRSGSTVHTIDSGLSQSITIEDGPESLAEERMPNPVMLRPYRTFTEVTQPASPFVLRLAGGGKTGAVVKLEEADGGAWALEATRLIADHLETLMNEAGSLASENRPIILY